MSGSASGLGGIWNHLSLGGHPTTSTNPSFPLVKSDGSASPVPFAITGNVSGRSQAGNALHADYLFVNAGNSDSAIAWQINGRYDLEDRGTEKEPYRWGFQIRSARGRDDYSQLVALNQALDLNGPALKNALDELTDVDQWMRTFAMMSLNGTDDIYSRIWEHNFRYFVRPTDQKIIVLQWDLDRSFNLGVSSAITPTRNNMVILFSIPRYRLLFDGHLEDLAATTFNSNYTNSLASHLGAVTGDNMSPESLYVSSRANQGHLVGNDRISVTNTSATELASATNITISEVHYHPTDPTAA